MTRGGAALVAVVMTGVFAAPAWAHVTVEPSEAPTGTHMRFVLRVPNERDDASTTRVEVQLPANVTSIGTEVKEAWDATEAGGTITWEGGSIAPDETEEFPFFVLTPDAPGVLEFRTVQTYDTGEEVRWVGPADADEPAARVEVILATAPSSTGTPASSDTTERPTGTEGSPQPIDAATDATEGPASTTWIGIGAGIAGVLALAIAVTAMVRRRR